MVSTDEGSGATSDANTDSGVEDRDFFADFADDCPFVLKTDVLDSLAEEINQQRLQREAQRRREMGIPDTMHQCSRKHVRLRMRRS